MRGGHISYLRRVHALVGLALLSFSASAQAAYLNWGSLTWNATNNSTNTGTPVGSGNFVTHTYADGNAPGNATDISVTVLNNTGISNPWNSTPTIALGSNRNNYISGGDANASFQLWVNNETSTGYVQFTLNFLTSVYSAGVTNVSFTLYDIDQSGTQFIDTITNLQALTLGGSSINPTSVTTSVNNTYNATTNTATGTNTAGDLTGNGNVSVSFGNNVISSLTFRWSNSASGLGQQAIAVSGISYNPVIIPETGSALAGFACIAVLLIGQMVIRPRRSF